MNYLLLYFKVKQRIMLLNLVIRYKNVINFNILLIYWILTYYDFASTTELRIRDDSKLFVRFNLKINALEFSKIFAHAIGFRVNFDLRKSKKPKRIRFDEGMSTHFHPEQVQKVTEYLFNSYGLNGTACVIRTMCEIFHIPAYSYDVLGPLMKLTFLGSMEPQITRRYCENAVNCPISILHLLTHDEFQ